MKLILTTRQNVFSEATEKTKLTRQKSRGFRVYVDKSNEDVQREILGALLEYNECKPHKREMIFSEILWNTSPFENLLHVHDFATQIDDSINNKEQIASLLNDSRPSEYKRWLQDQSASVQLFLILLWLATEVSREDNKEDLQRTFLTLEKNPAVKQMSYSTADLSFYSALNHLKLQERLQISSKDRYDFAHPELRIATKAFFEDHSEFVEICLSLIRALIQEEKPFEKSVAAFLAIRYFELVDISLSELEKISRSKYLQVRDTVIRNGVYLLTHHDGPIRQSFELFYSTRYTPLDNCIFDDNGDIIVVEKPFVEVTSAFGWYEKHELNPLKEVEKYSDTFKRIVSPENISELNAVERYWFVRWLTMSQCSLPDDDQIKLMQFLAYDYTAFVRSQVAIALGSEDRIHRIEFLPVLENLCRDSSPYVKIDALENAILPNWKNMPPNKQDFMLDLVVDMLDDIVVKNKVARGLVGESGTLWFYHADHTEEQKRTWFEAVAPKLLESDFYFSDDFDRFLTAFDKYLKDLNVDVRQKLLGNISRFVDSYPRHINDTPYTIQKLIFDIHNEGRR